jgi:hypothetical protein
MDRQLSIFAEQIDVVIKASSAAKVISSSETIAEEVLRQQPHHVTEDHGTVVSREQLKEHRNEADKIKDEGIAYRETEDNGREIYCLVCQTYCGSKGDVGIGSLRETSCYKAMSR